MKKIIYMRPDGGMSIVHPCISTEDPADFTEQQALERALNKDIPTDAIDIKVINETDLPSDWTFRNAWKHDNGIISHDMDKCREMWKNHMRAKRTPLLLALDTAYMRADEAGDSSKKNTIAQQKQALRDVTSHPDIATAQTPEDLKAVWPEILGNKGLD